MNNQSRTVVFVTGAFVSHHCWDDWVAHFASQGYTAFAPPHPHKDEAPGVLRSQHPRSPIAHNTITDVVQAYADFIQRLPERPVLIGHSFGGLIVQLLLQRDLAVAGVAIDSVPPQGVLSFKWSFVRSITPALGLLTSVDKTYLMSFRHWQYTFTNGMPRAEQMRAYERLVVPESKRMARGALTRGGRVDFARPHAPLLFLAGSDDHIIPASLNRTNYQRYARHPGSITEFMLLRGRNHYVLGQPHWQVTADIARDWLESLGARSKAASRIAQPAFVPQPA